MNDKFGSINFINHASICLQTTISGYALTIGSYGKADLENASYVIMAGANRAEAILTPIRWICSSVHTAEGSS